MFCKKCGNQLGENEPFCPKCGTKVGQSGNGAVQLDAIKDKAGQVTSKALNSANSLGKNAPLLFITIGTLILSFILSFTKLLKYDFGILGYFTSDLPQLNSFGGVSSIWAVFHSILYIAAIIVVIFPFFTTKIWNPGRFALQIVTGFITLLSFLILYGVQEGVASDACSISFAGWLFLLSTIAMLVLSFIMISHTKRGKRAREQEEMAKAILAAQNSRQD